MLYYRDVKRLSLVFHFRSLECSDLAIITGQRDSYIDVSLFAGGVIHHHIADGDIYCLGIML